MIELKSIEEEEEDCRAAFAGVGVGTPAVHLHHGIAVERLTEPPEARISHILASKDYSEQALRLRLFRPVFRGGIPMNTTYAEVDAVYVRWDAAYAELKKAFTIMKSSPGYKWCQPNSEYDKACLKYGQARAEALKALAKFHEDLCMTPGCPWDGETIFAKGTHS